MRSRLSRCCAAVLLAVLLFAAGSTSITAYASNNVVQDVREGTVAVVFYLKNAAYYITDGTNIQWIQDIGDTEFSGGSGFFIGESGKDPQYIVTNNHVIEDYISTNEGGTYLYLTDSNYQGFPVLIGATSCELRIYYSEDDYDIAYVDCHGETEKVDLAVLRLRNVTDKRHTLKLLAPTEDMVGDTVYTVGYPGNADNALSGASHYGINDSTVHTGSINRFVVNDGLGVERIAVDATIQHGNSGGPLVSKDGYVVGVNTNTFASTDGSIVTEVDYYAISSNELIRFLDKNNIPYELADDSGSGAVVIIVIVVVVIAAAAVGAFVVMNKKKGQGQKAPKDQTVNNSAKKAVIRSMSAQHAGKAFPVGKAPVLIGRNPAECVIVFKEGTPGVSGRHCSVYYSSDTGMFTLTDLNSSYGTFLSNGMKLTANSPISLNPGDSFYVGDKTNVIKVEVEQ